MARAANIDPNSKKQREVNVAVVEMPKEPWSENGVALKVKAGNPSTVGQML